MDNRSSTDGTRGPDAGKDTRKTTPPRVIAMLNQKGGVGKTTSTVNIGAALADAGCRVCLIDLDPQAHLTLHLGIDAGAIERTVYDLLIDPACEAEEVRIREARPRLDVMLAEVDLAAAETELSALPDRQSILRRKMASIASEYDVIMIDCPPSLGLLTLNALAFATEIFVPMQAHFLALQGVGRLLETVGLVCQSVNPRLQVAGIILCMHESQTTLAREIVADIDAFFEAARHDGVPWSQCRVLQPPIRRNIKLAEAPSFGNTILDYAPWCPGALDYRRLAQGLLERWTGPAAAATTTVETKPDPRSQPEAVFEPASHTDPTSTPEPRPASPPARTPASTAVTTATPAAGGGLEPKPSPEPKGDGVPVIVRPASAHVEQAGERSAAG